MINWWKFIPWLLVLILATILFFSIKGCRHSGAIDGPIQDSTITWKNKYGQVIVSIKKAQEELAQARKEYRDSIADVLNTKEKLVKEVIDLKLHGKITIYADTGKDKMVIIYKDTEQVESATQIFSNQYYQVIASLNLEHQALSSVQVQTFDSLLIGWKTVKEGGLFNRKTYLELDIKNANPYSTIAQVKAYRVPPAREKRWGIGPFVGWGWGFNAQGPVRGYPVVGLGVQYSLIKF